MAKPWQGSRIFTNSINGMRDMARRTGAQAKARGKGWGKAQENGFTLVELAIALVVIGLLIGGVLKGQELVVNARINTVAQDMRKYTAAIISFNEAYGAFPGDIRSPSTALLACTTDFCSQGGNGDGRIGNHAASGINRSSIGNEPFNVFVHLSKAGMIEQMFDPKVSDLPTYWSELFFPKVPLRGSSGPVFLRVYHFRALDAQPLQGIMGWPPGHVFHTEALGRYVTLMDAKMDDGKPYTGNIRSPAPSPCAQSTSVNAYIAASTASCPVFTRADF